MIGRWMTGGAWGLAALLAGACYGGETEGQAALADAAQQSRVGEACLTSKECAEDEYCFVPEGECGRTGECQLRPLECGRDRPVCGCDGVTYQGGACDAAVNGESVDFQDECPPPPCFSSAECGAGQYCAKATGDCAGYGACTGQPAVCSNVWNPVCGCNGVTYGNACKAAKAGATIAKTGKC